MKFSGAPPFTTAGKRAGIASSRVKRKSEGKKKENQNVLCNGLWLSMKNSGFVSVQLLLCYEQIEN